MPAADAVAAVGGPWRAVNEEEDFGHRARFVIASEAKQSRAVYATLDCFASLAMTDSRRPQITPARARSAARSGSPPTAAVFSRERPGGGRGAGPVWDCAA